MSDQNLVRLSPLLNSVEEDDDDDKKSRSSSSSSARSPDSILYDKIRSHLFFKSRTEENSNKLDSAEKNNELQMRWLKVTHPFLPESQLRGKVYGGQSPSGTAGRKTTSRSGKSPNMKEKLLSKRKERLNQCSSMKNMKVSKKTGNLGSCTPNSSTSRVTTLDLFDSSSSYLSTPKRKPVKKRKINPDLSLPQSPDTIAKKPMLDLLSVQSSNNNLSNELCSNQLLNNVPSKGSGLINQSLLSESACSSFQNNKCTNLIYNSDIDQSQMIPNIHDYANSLDPNQLQNFNEIEISNGGTSINIFKSLSHEDVESVNYNENQINVDSIDAEFPCELTNTSSVHVNLESADLNHSTFETIAEVHQVDGFVPEMSSSLLNTESLYEETIQALDNSSNVLTINLPNQPSPHALQLVSIVNSSFADTTSFGPNFYIPQASVQDTSDFNSKNLRWMNKVSPIIDENIENPLMPALFTPPHVYKLSSNLMLSNFSCCYKKKPNNVDLKPNPFKNYYVDDQLKDDFVKIIPLEKDLMDFFYAPEQSAKQTFKKVKKDVCQLDKLLY